MTDVNMNAQYAVIAVLSANDDVTDEATREFTTLDDALGAIKLLNVSAPEWRLITICHVEDLPALMQGTRRNDGGMDWDD